MAEFGRETIVFFEIDMPFCSLSYGVAACPAVLGIDSGRKCYNTRATCPVPLSYDGDSRTSGKYVTLRFCRPQDAATHYGPVIPMLAADPRVTPAVINLAGMDRNMGALGQRESVAITLDDSRHSDNLVDKYRLQRPTGVASSSGETYDPYTRGTFWGKFIARNPYLVGYPCRIREGFVGDELDDMRVRNYVIDKLEGPTDGQVSITAKDVFSLIEARKSVAPIASSGELQADITDTAGAATLAPAGIGNAEYPASGYICIGTEVIAFTRAGDALTLTARHELGTTAAEHKAQDVVQVVLYYSADLFRDIAYDLFTNYSAVPVASISLARWDIALSGVSELFTRVITKPTPVVDLLGSLCEVAGITLLPDVSTGSIDVVALRASAATVTIDDDAAIIDGSFSKRTQDVKRVSQVWVFYGQRDPTADGQDESNYHSRLLEPDLEAESPQQYGVPAIRKIFGFWIPQFGRSQAQAAADRIMAVYRDAPDEAQFAIVASRDGSLSLAQPFLLEVAEVQDETGQVASVQHVPLSIASDENEIRVQSQRVTFVGSDGGGNDRTIFIENNALNLNLRTIHDSIYATPTGTETVTFIVQPGIVVGSPAASLKSMKTGDWPVGQPLFLTVQGRIQGKGGASGRGGEGTAVGDQTGAIGEGGGDALEVTAAITIDNTTGQIWGGGGGGGGGGGSWMAAGPVVVQVGGGAGSGAAGTTPGSGAAGGIGPDGNGGDGTAGTADASGVPGAGVSSPYGFTSGNGGDGGEPGEDGDAGTSGTGPAAHHGVPGAGGSKGRYVVGAALVTWAAVGDVRGSFA